MENLLRQSFFKKNKARIAWSLTGLFAVWIFLDVAGISYEVSEGRKELRRLEESIWKQQSQLDSLRQEIDSLSLSNTSVQQKTNILNKQIFEQKQEQESYQNDQAYKQKSYQSCVDLWTATDGGYIKPEHEQLCR